MRNVWKTRADFEKNSNWESAAAELMKKAADIGISVNIVHPSAEPNKENERGEKIKRA